MIQVTVPPPGEFLRIQIEAKALDNKIKLSVRRVATEYRGKVIAALQKAKSGRTYRYKRLFGASRRVQASAPGEEPGIATGRMMRMVRAKMWRDGYGGRVFVPKGNRDVFYRGILEFGTKTPRPRVRRKREVTGRDSRGRKTYRLLSSADRGTTGMLLPRPMWSPLQDQMTDAVQAAVVNAVNEFGAAR